MMIYDDHPACTEEPRASRREEAHRSGAENDHGVALLNAAHFRSLIARRHDVGQENSVVRIQPLRNDHRADVSVGDAHILCLAAVISAGGMGIAEYASHRRRLRV
ncbi:hypothetical protein D3C80_1803760 [compost metagenome]